ncbi:MAG TPA: transcriptional regulator NrdR [Thermosynechococcaceae cyanobacterium]
MRCPSCQHIENRVLESRSADAGSSVRRRRECLKCNNRFTTYERVESIPITVTKRDDRREPFDRFKLLRGITRACEKTGVTATAIEKLADIIEAELQQRFVRDVSTSEIGELVLHHLQGVSEVAYIRFASVYRQFQGIRDFVDTLDHLQGSNVQPLEEAANGNTNGVIPSHQTARRN